MRKQIIKLSSIFFLAMFLMLPSLALAGTCVIGGQTIPFLGDEATQRSNCESRGGQFTPDAGAGGGGGGGAAGSTTDGCGNPCPAGTICFKNPLSVCSVKGLVMNLLTNLQGIIALIAIVMIVVGGIMYMASGGNDKAMERAKMIITAAVVGLALTLAAPTFVKEILKILQGNSMDPGNLDQVLTIQGILLGILDFLLACVGIIAIIAMVIGGGMYLTAYGDEDRAKKGKQIATYAIVGIAIAIGSLIIVKQVAELFGIITW